MMKKGVSPKPEAIAIAMLWLWSVAQCVPDTTITNILCNAGEYTSGDPFAISIDHVLRELETQASTHKNYNYFTISPYPNAFAYGHATCNTNLTTSDCKTCLASAKTALFGTCQRRIGARSVLHDCTIRYEQYPFDD